MLDLAEHNSGEYITLPDIAKRQEISEKYLESIISILSKNGFVLGQRGKGGGYKLARPAESYTIGSIIKLTEKVIAPISCLSSAPNACKRATSCKTLPMWTKLANMIDDFFEGITLTDLLENNIKE